MATREVLAELAAAYGQRSGRRVVFESVGGVDAAKRVQAGEPFDLVVLTADAIERLMASGHLQAGSRVDGFRSPVAVAVRAGAPRPDIGSEGAVRQAVLAARSIGFSTGPSGVYLMQLFDRWGIADQIKGRIRQAPAGVPVGALVARGEVELGFQQLSELLNLEGVEVIGTLPLAIEFITTFSAGRYPGSAQAEAVTDLLDFMNSGPANDAKRRHGMAPA